MSNETGFPGDENPIPHLTDASEFRDIDLTTLSAHQSEYATAANETHTVPDRNVGRRLAVNDGGRVVEYEDVQPVAARTFDAYTIVLPAGTAAFPGQPVRIVGDDPQRMRLIITTAGSDIALVGPLGAVGNGDGFALIGGTQLETKVQGGLYACTPVGELSAITIHVWVERGI